MIAIATSKRHELCLEYGHIYQLVLTFYQHYSIIQKYSTTTDIDNGKKASECLQFNYISYPLLTKQVGLTFIQLSS